MENADGTDEEKPIGEPQAPALGEASVKYLDDRAFDSFKRQTDLEESIWRSMPLFTGGLLAGGAIVANAADGLPTFKFGLFEMSSFILIFMAVIAFCIAFWWLWQVVRPRYFDYPADDEAISQYALGVMNFHFGQGLKDKALDDEVARELRLYMAGTFAMAAKSTFSNNQIRLSARSQVLIFLLSGFLLAFACEAIIFGHRLIFEAEVSGATISGTQAPHNEQRSCRAETRAAYTASDAGNSRWGMANEINNSTSNSEQVNGRRRQADQRVRSATHASGSAGSASHATSDENRAGQYSESRREGRPEAEREVASRPLPDRAALSQAYYTCPEKGEMEPSASIPSPMP
jgi:hypothetical protein